MCRYLGVLGWLLTLVLLGIPELAQSIVVDLWQERYLLLLSHLTSLEAKLTAFYALRSPFPLGGLSTPLISEVERDPVHSVRYGHQRQYTQAHQFEPGN